MAKIVRTVQYVRGPVGQLAKWAFIAFNIVMLLWLFDYWTAVAPILEAGSEAHRTGASIGVAMGTGLIVMIWGLGDVILGIPVLLTRGKQIEIEESRPPPELTLGNVATAMQSAYQAAKGRTDKVGLGPTKVGANASGKQAAQHPFSARFDPAWLIRFRELDPGKRFVIVCSIGAAAILVVGFIVLGSLTPPPLGNNGRGTQSSTNRGADEDVDTRTARENQLTVNSGATNLPTALPPRTREKTPGSTIVDPSKIPPSWLVLRQGVRAFTGDDGGGASGLTICPSVRLYRRWFSDGTAVVPECVEMSRDIPVTIGSDEIVSSGLVGEYFVFIRADKASWSGWTGSLGLQPYIPANTRAVVNTPSPKGEVWLFPDRTAAGGHIVLRSGATVQILSQDTKSGDRPGLYVQVTGDSPDSGERGWVHSLGLNVQSGGPLLFTPPYGANPKDLSMQWK